MHAERALHQTADKYLSAPPQPVRVCVLDAAPVVTANVPDSILQGATLSSIEAQKVSKCYCQLSREGLC